tara:strand:- start:707 stop:1132 length:426 start_codon:yes stop_codon:yes gene_type:complete
MIALIIPDSNQCILSVSGNGYGKRTKSDGFPVYGRGGQGVIAMQASDRNGPIVGAAQVAVGDEIMLISDKGTLVRTRVDEVSIQGRNTQGVRLIRLKDGEKLVGLEAVQDPEETLSEVNESEESLPRLESRESDGAGDGHK